MISVIITTHDGRADLCKRAIKSVLKQSYQDFEIIVVDDASKDKTEEIVKQLQKKDSRIVYVKREENFGTDTKPKNEGILVSKGEYIAFLDSDNTYRLDHLQVLYNAIKDSEYDVVYGDRWIRDKTGQVGDRVGVNSDYNPFLLFEQNYIDTSDVLIKRQALFDVGGFDERYRKFIDWNMWVRMAKYGHRFKRVPAIITDYYIHKDMKSMRKEDEIDARTPKWNAYDTEVELDYLGKKNEPKVAIFSITYNRLDYTKKCFESMHKTAGYKFKHFIVDNGSTDGTRDWLVLQYRLEAASYKVETDIYLNNDNKGISIASNQALEMIGNDYDIIVKVDNDCLFKTKGWLKTMVKLWKANHMLALSCYIEGLRDNPGGAPRFTYGELQGELVGMTRHLGGICHFVDAKAYDNFRWDEDSTLHGVQDLEFSQYLGQQGYQMGYLENYFAEHYEGTEGQHKRYPEYFERRKLEKTQRYEKNRKSKH